MSFAGLSKADKELFNTLSEGGTFIDFLESQGNDVSSLIQPEDNGEKNLQNTLLKRWVKN